MMIQLVSNAKKKVPKHKILSEMLLKILQKASAISVQHVFIHFTLSKQASSIVFAQNHSFHSNDKHFHSQQQTSMTSFWYFCY